MSIDIGGIVGGIMGAQASETASEDQLAASRESIAEQQREFDLNQKNQQPYLQAGQGAVNQLSTMMQPGGQLANTTPTLAQLQMDPSYGFVAQQGINALAASGAASGNYGSGNMGVALQNYGQGLASTQYQNALGNWQGEQTNLYNRLAGLSGTGQVAANNLGVAGSNMANSVGNALQTGANNASAYNVQAAQQMGNALGSGSGGSVDIGKYINAYQQNNYDWNQQNGNNQSGTPYTGQDTGGNYSSYA